MVSRLMVLVTEMALLGKGAPGTNAAQRPAHKAAAATKRRERRPIIFDSMQVLIGKEGYVSSFFMGSIAVLLSEYQTWTRATRQAKVVIASPRAPVVFPLGSDCQLYIAVANHRHLVDSLRWV